MFGIAFLLVISIAYAGVLNYYGKIVGTANVQSPKFYAHSETESYDKTYYLLKANVQPDGALKEVSAGIYQSVAGEYETIIDIGWLFPQVSSWYQSNWKFFYEVKIENADKARFFTRIYKFDTSTYAKSLIKECPKTDYITSTTYITTTSTCEIPSISLNQNERILIEYWASIDVNAETLGKIYLKIDDPSSTDPTRIEVLV
jgi:hypothetical protein